MVYTWQFAQGSFINIVWKKVAMEDEYGGGIENRYFKNVSNTINAPQFNSLSLRVIYFIDYLTAKSKLKRKNKL